MKCYLATFKYSQHQTHFLSRILAPDCRHCRSFGTVHYTCISLNSWVRGSGSCTLCCNLLCKRKTIPSLTLGAYFIKPLHGYIRSFMLLPVKLFHREGVACPLLNLHAVIIILVNSKHRQNITMLVWEGGVRNWKVNILIQVKLLSIVYFTRQSSE